MGTGHPLSFMTQSMQRRTMEQTIVFNDIEDICPRCGSLKIIMDGRCRKCGFKVYFQV
jgi:ribosomal protein L40E